MHPSYHEIHAVGVSYSRNYGRTYAMPSNGILTIADNETVIVYGTGNVHTLYKIDGEFVESQDYQVGQKV